jgi:hypothetical protein
MSLIYLQGMQKHILSLGFEMFMTVTVYSVVFKVMTLVFRYPEDGGSRLL